MSQPAATASIVLVIDDDADIRESLTDILECEGYVVRSAANGRDGLAYLRAHPSTSLVLLDLMMPVMDGFEFRAEQRLDPVLVSIPVIVMTARGELEPGAIDAREVLPKPLKPQRLLDCVRRIQDEQTATRAKQDDF